MINKMKALSGDSFVTSVNKIEVKHPKLKEVKEFGSDIYFMFVNMFNNEPHERAVELTDIGIDFESVSKFEIFYSAIPKTFEYLGEIFKFFFDVTYITYEDEEYSEDSNLILYYKNKSMKYMSKRDFDEISEFFQTIHAYEPTEKPKFKNKRVKDVWIEIAREEKEMRNAEDGISFTSLISALVWASKGVVTWISVWDLYMYQFQDGIKQIDKEKEYDYLMYGVYNGTVDVKKINLAKHHWAR